MQVALEIIAVILIVDFVSGVLHWLEDRYGRPEWPVSGKWVTIPNIIHHHDPTYFTKHSWFKSAEVLLVLGVVIILFAWYLNFLSWHVLLFVAIGISANEIHKSNHLPKSKRNRVIVFLQKLKLLQTPGHHAKHHTGCKATNYCVITNVLNPMLEAITFWRILEWVIYKCLDAHKRLDMSVSSDFRGFLQGSGRALMDKGA